MTSEDQTRMPPRKGEANADLSAEIVHAVERAPGDTVRCTRVAGDTYRCNWWAPEVDAAAPASGATGGGYLTVATHRVRQSRFLHVTRGPAGAGLVIDGATTGAVTV